METKKENISKEEKLLDILNKTIKKSAPVFYYEFNTEFFPIDSNFFYTLDDLILNDKKVPTTLSLLATITNVLIGKKLAAQIDDKTGVIIGFQWYEEPQKQV